MKAGMMTRTAKEAAHHYLTQYWADYDDVVDFPVDPAAIATSSGIDVRLAKIKGDFVGFLVKEEFEAYPRIILDKKASEEVTYFACAHLLGRLSATSTVGVSRYDFTCKVSDLKNTPDTEAGNVFANNFALDLLLPDTALRTWWADGKSAEWIAETTNLTVSRVHRKLRSAQLS